MILSRVVREDYYLGLIFEFEGGVRSCMKFRGNCRCIGLEAGIGCVGGGIESYI